MEEGVGEGGRVPPLRLTDCFREVSGKSIVGRES